jgi:hypothetical protein
MRKTQLEFNIWIRIDRELRDWLEAEAASRRLPVAAFIRQLLSQAMQAERTHPPKEAKE